MGDRTHSVIGWDIGGVNIKVARVADGEVLSVRSRAFELQRAPNDLASLLQGLARDVGGDMAVTAHAVTMTAELSQMFRTKRDGVGFVLDGVEAAFPSAAVRVYTVDGKFLTPAKAREAPIDVAAANWAATARAVAEHHPDSLLIDIGTTSTDIIPIVGGVVVAVGRTDPGRLASGELVYTGALRTPTEAIASHVVVDGHSIGVSAEGFALAGDVHVWRGDLDPADYTVDTPDGRPPTREFAGERLARVICSDRELLGEEGVTALATSLAAAQVARISSAVEQVHARHPLLRTAVVTGVGAFLGAAAAREAGLEVASLAAELGDAAARCAPAACVALLLEKQLRSGSANLGLGQAGLKTRLYDRMTSTVDVVVKIGGGLLSQSCFLDTVLAAIRAAARQHRIVIVPGGGPFADTVRGLDKQVKLSDDAAHWMAVLGMDQYAHVIASRLDGASIVETPLDIITALEGGKVPVLAPSRWLRTADPLPHSWEVTSDSIAAWVSGEVGANRLVLVKPPGVKDGNRNSVDEYFERTLPSGVEAVIVAADQIEGWVTSG
jgi:hypothetical protein